MFDFKNSLNAGAGNSRTNYKIALAIFVSLAVLMIVTRGHHFASATALPSASLAVFFLAGFYLRSLIALPILIVLAGALDVAAVMWGGVSADCFGPSYPFLVAAYGVLWFGGHWFANHYQEKATGVVLLVAVVLGSLLVSKIISSGSYYLLSGSFPDPTVAEFAARIAKYYPRSLQSMAFYVATAAVIHCTVLVGLRASSKAGRPTT